MPIALRSSLTFALLLSACSGDDDDESPIDARVDAVSPDARPDAPQPADAGPDAAPIDGSLDAAADAAPSVDASPTADAALFVDFTSEWTPAEGLPTADCTAWTLSDTASPENPLLADGKLTLATSDDAEFMFYSQTTLMDPAILVFEARLRLVSSASTGTHRSGAAMLFRLGEPRLKNVLQLEDGKVFLLADENTRGPEASVATSDAPHTYRMIVNQATRAIQVERDGVKILDGAAYSDTSGLVPAIIFGDSSGVAHGTSEWLFVNHNAYLASFCP